MSVAILPHPPAAVAHQPESDTDDDDYFDGLCAASCSTAVMPATRDWTDAHDDGDNSTCDECGASAPEIVFCGECGMAYCLACDRRYHDESRGEDDDDDDERRNHFRQRLTGHINDDEESYDADLVLTHAAPPPPVAKAVARAVAAVPSLILHPALTRNPYAAAAVATAASARPASARPSSARASGGRAGRVAAAVSGSARSVPTPVPALALAPTPAPLPPRSARPASARPASRASSGRARPVSARVRRPLDHASATPSPYATPRPRPSPFAPVLKAPAPARNGLPGSTRANHSPSTATGAWGSRSTSRELVTLSRTIASLRQQVTTLETRVGAAQVALLRKRQALSRLQRVATEVERPVSPPAFPRARPASARPAITDASSRPAALAAGTSGGGGSSSTPTDDSFDPVTSFTLRPTTSDLAAVRTANDEVRLEIWGLRERVAALRADRDAAETDRAAIVALRVEHASLSRTASEQTSACDLAAFRSRHLVADLEAAVDQLRNTLEARQREQAERDDETRRVARENATLEREYARLQTKLDQIAEKDAIDLAAEAKAADARRTNALAHRHARRAIARG